MEKSRQATTALPEDWLISILPASGVVMPTEPCTTLGPVGNSPATSGRAVSAVAASSAHLRDFRGIGMARLIGEWRQKRMLPTNVNRLSSATSSSRNPRPYSIVSESPEKPGSSSADTSSPTPTEAARSVSVSIAVGSAR